MKKIHTLLQLGSTALLVLLCVFTPPAVSFVILACLAVRVLVFMRVCGGEKMHSSEASQKALLVLDMQEDMCGEAGMYRQKEEFVRAVNGAIAQAQQQGEKIVYIRQEFHRVDFLFCFLVFGGRFLQGLRGSDLCAELKSDGGTVLVKHQQDAFTSRELSEHLKQNSIGEISIVGLDASACVYKTALSAANRGYRISVIRDGVLSKHKNVTDRALQKLSSKGISIC